MLNLGERAAFNVSWLSGGVGAAVGLALGLPLALARPA